VRWCLNDRTDQLVIQAVVDIARGLGKRTVAEMVGDQPTLELLAELGVDHAQGYHIGKPAPLAKWLVEEKRKAERAAKGPLKVISRATS
jgi:EAL domain-containing protein (putative c-di-GMP-specific phosphodiesterase class I)